jgi:hypothetical protein
MNNISRVDKVTIEDGVFEFRVDLTPIVPALNTGNNTLEVEGTANMLVTGTGGQLDGFYALTCGQNDLSVFSMNGVFLSNDPSNSGAEGFYARRVIDTDMVVYEKFSNGDKFSIFFHPASGFWFLKHNLSNGVNVNQLLFQQCTVGTADEVPLKDWCYYPKVCGRSNAAGLQMRACIPFEGTDLILVNCGGLDEVNGCYYRDASNNRFVNVRDDNFVIEYVINSQTGAAAWEIQALCTEQVDCQGNVDEDCTEPTILYTNPVVAVGGACAACIPCCDWLKACATSPGNPPIVTPLEYSCPVNAQLTIKYFDNGSSTWSLFNGTALAATGMSNHYIVQRAGHTTPAVNGAYCFTCLTPQPTNLCPNPPSQAMPCYTFVLDTNITLNHNNVSMQWEIADSGTVLYFADSTDPSVPPFDGWSRSPGVAGPEPLVLSPVVPSCLTWTLI